MSRTSVAVNYETKIPGGGEMGRRIREFDWATTDLGSIDIWSQSLLTATNLLLQSPVPIVMLWGKDGRMIYNDAYSIFAGARHPFLLGSKVVEGWPEVADFNRNVMKHGLAGKTLSYTDQKLTLYRNNVAEDVWMNLNYSPVIDESSKPAGVMAIVVEITERVLAEQKEKEAEIALQNERDRLKTFLMQAPAVIAVLRGKEHVFELANPLYMQLVGKKRKIVGLPIRKALPEIQDQGFYELLDNVYKTKKPFVGNEVRVKLDRHNTGVLDYVYLNFVYQPSIDADGNVEGIFVHAVDVTDLVLAKEKYKTIFETMDQGFCVLEMIFNKHNKPIDYRFLELNPTFEKQTGLVNAAGRTARELVPDLEKHWFEIYGKVAVTGVPKRFTEGSSAMGKWFDVYAFKVGDQDSRKVALLFTDITERKQYEERLIESESYYREMTDNTPIMTWITDINGMCTYLNKPWYEYTGQQSAKALGTGWLDAIHPEDVSMAGRAFRKANEARKPIRIEYRLRRYDGVYRWHLDSGLPKFNDRGVFEGYIGSVVDIHERKMLERQKDDFLGIASHELKTPVTSIKVYTQTLESVFRRNGDLKAADQLKKMDGQIDKLGNLINDLLDVTKIQSGKMVFDSEAFDFNDLTDEVIEEIQRTSPNHKLLKEFGKAAPVYGDRERLGQVLTNLITNAIKYSPNADKVYISTFVKNNTVTISVKDFGVGIPKEKQQKVFDQFFRVSGPKQNTFPGLGLGLYISSEIVKRVGGRIWVESEEGNGSTFYFSLPLRKAQKKKKS